MAPKSGAGIILSAALVHLLSPGVDSLSNPCLPAFFSEDYTALGNALCCFAALLMMGLEHTAEAFLGARAEEFEAALRDAEKLEDEEAAAAATAVGAPGYSSFRNLVL